jgi:decaprenylphospho-beta-D-erythro-pentofuranosid-2-ulose 2-reductase
MKDGLGGPQSMLVLGGASDIAIATVQAFAATGTRRALLAAREPDRLDGIAKALANRLDITLTSFDATAFDTHPSFVSDAFDRLGEVDLVLLAFGMLPDQAAALNDPSLALEAARVNYLGAISVLLPIADRLRAQGHGDIVVLSSVAGERGRRSNYVYGSTKAGLDVFCQGLGDDLAGTGVHLLVVRPGFVRSKMTGGLDPAPLSTDPRSVALAIVNGVARGADVVWVPPALRPVMSALRHLPRPLFRRLEI